MVKLKSSLRKVYGRRHCLVNCNGISVINDHRIWSSHRNHNHVLSSFMTYHRIFNNNNTMGESSGAEQELLTLPEHLNFPSFLVEFVLLNLSFLWYFAYHCLSFPFWQFCLSFNLTPLIISYLRNFLASILFLKCLSVFCSKFFIVPQQ